MHALIINFKTLLYHALLLLCGSWPYFAWEKILIFTSIFAHAMSNGLFTFSCQQRLCNIIVVKKSEQQDWYFYSRKVWPGSPKKGQCMVSNKALWYSGYRLRLLHRRSQFDKWMNFHPGQPMPCDGYWVLASSRRLQSVYNCKNGFLSSCNSTI